jgi:DNA-binding HxlR family transcriptional regulator
MEEIGIMMQLVFGEFFGRPMQRRCLEDSTCPVARSLDSIGDWWTLLIVRDAMLGVRRFSDFQRSLGLARNVLTARLKKMVADGVMTTAPAADGTSYMEYRLTEKGEALLPVLVAMRQWGERFLYAPGEPHSELIEKGSGKALERICVRDVDGEELGVADLELAAAS